MEEILKKALTIEEKSKGFITGNKINYTYLTEWRNVRTLLSDHYFNIMLDEMQLSKEEFAYSLQPYESIIAPEGQEWYEEFLKIINKFDYENLDYESGVYLLTLPFCKYLYNEIKMVLNNIKNIQVEENVIDKILGHHNIEMFNIIGKIMALKLSQYKQLYKFRSKDEKERFIEFLKATLNCKENFIDLFKEYPVVARIATIRTLYLKKNYCQLLKNIDKDFLEIKEFLGENKLVLTDIEIGAGDSHEQGKSVSILCFGTKKLVYKPKNLKICKAIEEFISWCISSADLLPLRFPKGIYKEEYTYNEFISPQYCKTNEEIEKYYVRFGYLIAICYILNLNDIHLENLIADGEYPIIVDIETVFQISQEMEIQTLYADLIKKLEVESVSNSLLLPKKMNMGIKDLIDLSALAGKEVKLSQKFLTPSGINTDKFRFEKVPGYFLGGNNIPRRNETEEVDAQNYYLKIVEGFDEFIAFVMENKEQCIKKLSIFQGKKIRCLVKGTEKYASMLRYADHPNYNSEMKYRERLMMNVWAYPYLDKRIIKSEVRDLLFNDIPIFYSYTDSKDIIDSQGYVYKDYYKVSGLELVIKKIRKLSKTVVDMQRTIICQNLGISDLNLNRKIMRREIVFKTQKFSYIKEAEKVAKRIIDESFVKKSKRSFINVDCDNEKHWELTPCDEGLYGGLSGIAVFFLELYISTNIEDYYMYYKEIISTAIEQTKNTGFRSAFTEWLSPVYPLLLEYRYLKKIEDRDFLNFTIEKLKSLTITDIHVLEGTDYISGMSGVLRLLTCMQKVLGEKEIPNQLIQNFYLEILHRIQSEQEKTIKNVGIAHGISGVMLAIASTHMAEPQLIKEYLAIECKLKVAKKDIYKWCWGLPGMIQSRIELLKINEEYVDINQLNMLIEMFEKSLTFMVSEDSLCHGNGSIITTLKMLYLYTKEKKWFDNLQLWITNIYVNSLLNGFEIPKMNDIYTKGIFDGISGIGWLYLYANSDLDNLLLLEIK